MNIHLNPLEISRYRAMNMHRVSFCEVFCFSLNWVVSEGLFYATWLQLRTAWSVPYSQSAGMEYFMTNSNDFYLKFVQYFRLSNVQKLKKAIRIKFGK